MGRLRSAPLVKGPAQPFQQRRQFAEPRLHIGLVGHRHRPQRGGDGLAGAAQFFADLPPLVLADVASRVAIDRFPAFDKLRGLGGRKAFTLLQLLFKERQTAVGDQGGNLPARIKRLAAHHTIGNL